MFTIEKVSTKRLHGTAKQIDIEFTYSGPPKEIIVRINEKFFDVGFRVIGGLLRVEGGIKYWISDVMSEGISYRMVDYIDINFIEKNTDNIIESHKVNIGNDNFLLRSQGGVVSRKNIWIIGDSNIYNYFNKFKYGSDEFNLEESTIVPIDIPELSINRFVNRDNIKFLNSLPIMDNDEIIFIIGEIDCRVGFYRNSIFKEKNVIDQVNNVVDRYIEDLKNIIKEFPRNEIKISLPNPTLKDGWLLNKDDLTYNSSQNDRLFIRKYFEVYLKSKTEVNNIKCLDLTDGFQDEYGFTKEEILVKNDTHNKPTDIIINNLRKHYQQND